MLVDELDSIHVSELTCTVRFSIQVLIGVKEVNEVRTEGFSIVELVLL